MPFSVPYHSLQILLLLATQWLVKSPQSSCRGGGEPCGVPVASLQYTVSLVQWVKRLLPAQGAAVCIPGMHPHLQWNWVLLSAMSHYTGFDRTKLCSQSRNDLCNRLPQCLPRFHSAPCRSSSSQHSDWLNPEIGTLSIIAIMLH